jgi:vacuolar-type H+-ATPase subunit I/STV1
MNDTIERLDNVAMHLLTENATLARVIRHCKERQEEIRERLRQVEELIAKERDLKGDRLSVATQTFTGQSDSQKTHAMAVSG